MPEADMDLHWMTEQSARIILATVDNDSERAADGIERISQRYGAAGMYCLCCALAESFARMSGEADKRDGDTWFGFEIHHLDTGPMAPEQVDADAQDAVTAMRFITAALNRDSEQCLALFHAPTTPEEAWRLVIGLLKLVGAAGRYRLEQKGAAP